MSLENEWIVNTIEVNESGHLVVDIEPGWHNRKKLRGEIELKLSPPIWRDVVAIAEEKKSKDSQKIVAEDEMREFLEKVRIEYFDFRESLALRMKVSQEELPRPYMDDLESPTGEISFISK